MILFPTEEMPKNGPMLHVGLLGTGNEAHSYWDLWRYK